MQILKETYHRLLANLKPLYIRKFYQDFKFEHRMMGLVGPRGVGKTSFLLYYLKKHYQDSAKAIYFSADHLFFTENSLLETVDRLYQEDGLELICIDEIHRYQKWNQELKNIYDAYPNLKIIFSGSSSLDLIHGKYDLSRRALLRPMSGFSFREFLEKTLQQKFPTFTLDEITKNSHKCSLKFANIPKLIGHFKQYLRQGYYPIYDEIENYNAYTEVLNSLLDKTIFEDISSFYSLKTSNLATFHKLLYFLATSRPGSININKLAKSLKKDHSTIAEYLQILKESGVLRFLSSDKTGHALIRKAEKIYLHNPNLLYAISSFLGNDVDLGYLRELFVLSQLEEAGLKAFYAPQGDLVCQKYTFEIGGKNKTEHQIKGIKHSYVVQDDVLIGGEKNIPLYLFGFLR